MTPMFRGDLAFLSNFWEQEFWVPELDMVAPSSEHAFMALKTEDKIEQAFVLNAPTPGLAKQRGRDLVLRPDWETGARVWAMQRVLVAKFSVPDLATKLAETGDTLLAETNYWHDQFWGNCYCDLHKDIPGVNMLGELLMGIRTAGRMYRNA